MVTCNFFTQQKYYHATTTYNLCFIAALLQMLNTNTESLIRSNNINNEKPLPQSILFENKT